MLMVFRLVTIKWCPDFFGNVEKQVTIVLWVSLGGAVISSVIMFSVENLWHKDT